MGINKGYDDDLEWGVVTEEEFFSRTPQAVSDNLDDSDYILRWKLQDDSKDDVDVQTKSKKKKKLKEDLSIWDYVRIAFDIGGLIDLIDFMWATKILKKSPSVNLPRYATEDISIDMNAQYCKDTVIYHYVIEDYPRELDVAFRDCIRACAQGKTRVNFVTYMDKYDIPWDEPRLKNQLEIWNSLDKESQEHDYSAYNYRENFKQETGKAWLGASLVYLHNSEMGIEKHFTYKTRFFMDIVGVRGDEFDTSVVSIEMYCIKADIKLRRVIYDINEFVPYMSPFKMNPNNNMDKSIPKFILTDELLGMFPTFSQGIIGDIGIYQGTDIYSGKPVVKMYKRDSTDAENIVILAETRGGKSALIKTIVQQLSCRNVYGLIFDMAGEYMGLAKLMANSSNVEVLNMGGLDGGIANYFDPVEILTEIHGLKLDIDSYTMSVDFTRSVFKVLGGEAYKSSHWSDIVISDAISQNYKLVGVKGEERDTWANSKGLVLSDVFITLKKTLKSYNQDAGYQQTRALLESIYSDYFEETGSRCNMFKNKANLEKVVKADLIIGHFNLVGQAINTIDPIVLNLMQLSAARIAQLRTLFAYKMRKMNYKVWEEFQYWGDFPDSDKTIGAALTLNGKLGDINFVVSNQPDKLLASGGVGIFQNKTSIMIGAIDDASIRRELVERLSIPNMLPELDRIAKESIKARGTSRNTTYRYAFLQVLDGKATITKMMLPRYILDSELIYSGVREEETSFVEDDDGFREQYGNDIILEDDDELDDVIFDGEEE